MELRQLIYFDAVVRHGGFTRAAEQLHVAQPAISAQIRRLEAELGLALLHRSTRQVSLTQAGELFWARCRRVIDELETARAELYELTSVLRGKVRIGATPVLGSLSLPAMLAEFRRRYPGVALTLGSGLIDDLLEQLDGGQLDVVIGPVAGSLPQRHRAEPLVDESTVIVTPPGHRVVADRPLTLGSFRDDYFVCLPSRSGLHAILVEAATAEGFVPRIEFETYSPTSIRELVAAGLGVALLARSSALAPGPRVDVHLLTPSPWHPTINLIVASGRDASAPSTKAFCNFLRRAVASGGSE